MLLMIIGYPEFELPAYFLFFAIVREKLYNPEKIYRRTEVEICLTYLKYAK